MSKYKELKQSLNKDYSEMAVIIARDYVLHGSYYKLASIYGTSKENLCRLVKSHLKYIQNHYPKIYKEYNLKIEESHKKRFKSMQQKSAEVRRNQKEYLLCFNNKAFEELPKQIKYKEFLNWCTKFETGQLSGMDLISMAEKNGIKVIG